MKNSNVTLLVLGLILMFASSASAQDNAPAPGDGDIVEITEPAPDSQNNDEAKSEESASEENADEAPVANQAPANEVKAEVGFNAVSEAPDASYGEEDSDEEEDDFSAPRRPYGTPAPGLGFEPAEPMLRGVLMAGGSDKDEEAPASVNTQRFDFHGFLRVPFNMGIGNGQNWQGDTGSSSTKFHTPPIVPDSDYLNWQYTDVTGGPWTEFVLSYGNKTAEAHVAVAAYNITDGGYKALTDQLGINQSFVSLKFPNLFGDKGGITANVGVFSNRYGGAGRYSADMYDTYLFGATHVAGENIRAFYDVGSRVTLHFEQGFGGKLNAVPFVAANVGAETPEYLPWQGPQEQGTTLLHHEHLGLSVDDKLFIGSHLMYSWTQDAEGPDEKDGKLINVGVDIKLSDFFFGDGYLGYSHIKVDHPLRLAGAVEFLHSWNGWSIVDNFFSDNSDDSPNDGGTIDSVLFQYTFSLARFMWHPREFWGQDSDFLVTLFGLYNHVVSESRDSYAENKLKYGANILFAPLKWLGIRARYDLVQPDLDNSYKAFHMLTGTLILRSDFVSNEEIGIGYTRYFYGNEVRAVYPNENHSLDKGILKISAIMWW